MQYMHGFSRVFSIVILYLDDKINNNIHAPMIIIIIIIIIILCSETSLFTQ